MYPQFPISANGLPGYLFAEIDNSKIEVKYDFSSPIPESDINLNFNKEKNTINLSIKNQPNPVLCGVLLHPVNSVTSKYSETELKIFLETDPNAKEEWGLLIKSPSDEGIDPKSEFLLGAEANNSKDYEKAFQYISSSAEKEYIPAMEALIDIYSTEESPYKDHYNIEDCINILKKLFDRTEDPEAGIRLANIYKSLKRPEEAKEILTRCADKSNEAKLMLAILLSRLTGELDETERSIQLLRELADEHMIEAISALITHLEKGYGTPLDDNEIKRLKDDLLNIKKKQFGEKYKYVIIGCAAAAAITCAVIVGIALFRRRRGH